MNLTILIPYLTFDFHSCEYEAGHWCTFQLKPDFSENLASWQNLKFYENLNHLPTYIFWKCMFEIKPCYLLLQLQLGITKIQLEQKFIAKQAIIHIKHS